MFRTDDDWYSRPDPDDSPCWLCWALVASALLLSVVVGLSLR